MTDVLHATLRDKLGTSNTRRLRKAGGIPAILYGQGKETVSLTVPQEDVEAVIRHGAKLVQVQGAVQDTALISEVQWDPFGATILHMDLTRVKVGDRVVTNVAVELRGVAPGTKEGGILEQPIHEVSLDCPVTAIPEKLELNINSLHLGQSLLVSDLELAAGIRLESDPELVVVQCVEPAVEVEEELLPAGANEPEVIGRKPEEAEED